MEEYMEKDITETPSILNRIKKRKIQKELERQKQVREEMKSTSSKFGDYVINKICNFKEELLRLEKQNNYVLQMNTKLKLENEILHQSLIEKDQLLKDVIILLGDKVCYSCSHTSNCDKLKKCSYCENKFCSCCMKSCQRQMPGQKYKCYKRLCKDCVELHEFCKDCINK
jgi:hypothetical protein